MVEQYTPIDVRQLPELERLAEQVKTTGKPYLLKRDGDELALLTPLKRAKRTRPKSGLVTKDDPLLRLIGIGRSGIPGGVSGKKHEYLAGAYRPTNP